VQLSDVQDHGGEEYAYRLRLGPPQPDFALRVTPATLNVAAGRAVPLDVYAVRRDGFAGDIDLALKSPASGFVLSGGRLPAGRDRVAVTLTAPQKPPDAPAALQLEGRARIGPGTVVHAAVPAEDMMQAFAYRHLVPAQALLAWVTGFRRMLPAVTLAASGPVRLPAGGTARVQVLVPESAGAANAPKLELRDPPAGVSVQEVTAAPGSLTLILRADAKTAKVGYADNLIVEAFAEFEIKRPGGKATKQRVPLGALPAIPFEIVTQ
jgi:hypothetical protein